MRTFLALLRKFPAVILAYALVLQPVLAGISLVQAHTATEICATGPGDSVPPPGQHHDGACCPAVCCGGVAGADLAPHDFVTPVLAAIPVPIIAPQNVAVSDWPNERPRAARGPPV